MVSSWPLWMIAVKQRMIMNDHKLLILACDRPWMFISYEFLVAYYEEKTCFFWIEIAFSYQSWYQYCIDLVLQRSIVLCTLAELQYLTDCLFINFLYNWVKYVYFLLQKKTIWATDSTNVWEFRILKRGLNFMLKFCSIRYRFMGNILTTNLT